MKQKLRKWMLRISATGILITGLLIIIVLNPSMSYANKTEYGSITIYHDHPIEKLLLDHITNSLKLLQASELYTHEFKLDICLNDGSIYPKLIERLRGRAFAWGFYNKVVLQGISDNKNNVVQLSGYAWNMTQLVAHELTHCLQFNAFGIFRSNPVANIATWKWEGYAEYVSRQSEDQKDHKSNLDLLMEVNSIDSTTWDITLSDGTIAPRDYYNYWMLVQYCIDIKRMTYQEILADTTNEETIRQEMLNRYQNN